MIYDMFTGLDPYYTDSAHHFATAGLFPDDLQYIMICPTCENSTAGDRSLRARQALFCSSYTGFSVKGRSVKGPYLGLVGYSTQNFGIIFLR